MKHLSVSLRLVAIAAILSFSSCKKEKTAVTAENNQSVVLNSRLANSSQVLSVNLTAADMVRLKTEGHIKASQDVQQQLSAKGTTYSPNSSISGGNGGGDFWGGGNCPPVSAATLNYYQNEANACCCSFAVCLQGEYCAFYFYYFTPSANSGCDGGGGGYQL
jgi:hypothetical protein